MCPKTAESVFHHEMSSGNDRQGTLPHLFGALVFERGRVKGRATGWDKEKTNVERMNE